MVFGAIGGVLHAVATVVFAVDHIVSGVAINIIAAGRRRLPRRGVLRRPRGRRADPVAVARPTRRRFTVPGLSDASARPGRQGLVPGVRPGRAGRRADHELSVFTMLALGAASSAPAGCCGTPRSGCGCARAASRRRRPRRSASTSTATSSSPSRCPACFAGFAGCYLAVVASSGYANGQTGGRGYIGLAAMIFGNWRPGGLLTGSLLFGYTEGARLRSGGESVHALLLLVALGLLVLAVWQSPRAGRVSAAAVGASSAPARCGGTWRPTTVPGDFTEMTPYVATLLVLALVLQRLRMPAADGQPYRRGRGRMSRRCPSESTGTICAGRRSRSCIVPTRRTPTSRSGSPAWSTTAGWSSAATSRTRRTASGCAPSAAWCRRCTRAAAAGWSRWPASTRRARR